MAGTRLLQALLAAVAAACASEAQMPQAGDPQPESARATPGEDPILRDFGGRDALEGWLLACDNVRVCRAQPRNSGGSLMIRRDPGPHGLVRVVLDGQEPGEASRPDPTSVRLAGIANASPARWQLDHEGDRLTLEGDAALEFARTLAAATALSYDGADGRLEVPLTGLREALAAMDEAQSHAGSEAAFVEIGPRPRSELAAAPDLPVVMPVPPDPPTALPAAFAARVRAASAPLLAEYECESDRHELDEAHAMSGTEAIVILACGHGNVSSSFVLLRAARSGPLRIRPIMLPRLPGDEADAAPIHTDVEWDPAIAAISSSGHSCAGGCGFASSWVFDGRDFVLTSHLIYEPSGAEALQLYRSRLSEPR
jgi:hypothetical protein